MKIKNLIEIIVFIFLAYLLLPKYTGFLTYIFKFLLYIIILLIFMIFLDRSLDKLKGYIEINYINWYRKYYESLENTKKDFLSNNIVKQIIYLIYLSITNRVKYYTYSKYFLYENKLIVSFFIFGLIFIFTLIYIFVF